MRDFVRSNHKDEHGTTVRELMKVLEPNHKWTEPPEIGLDHWYWFFSLSARRGRDDGYPQKIPDSEIMAWANLRGHTLTPWDVETLCAMDDAFVSETFVLIAETRGK